MSPRGVGKVQQLYSELPEEERFRFEVKAMARAWLIQQRLLQLKNSRSLHRVLKRVGPYTAFRAQRMVGNSQSFKNLAADIAAQWKVEGEEFTKQYHEKLAELEARDWDTQAFKKKEPLVPKPVYPPNVFVRKLKLVPQDKIEEFKKSSSGKGIDVLLQMRTYANNLPADVEDKIKQETELDYKKYRQQMSEYKLNRTLTDVAIDAYISCYRDAKKFKEFVISYGSDQEPRRINGRLRKNITSPRARSAWNMFVLHKSGAVDDEGKPSDQPSGFKGLIKDDGTSKIGQLNGLISGFSKEYKSLSPEEKSKYQTWANQQEDPEKEFQKNLKKVVADFDLTELENFVK